MPTKSPKDQQAAKSKAPATAKHESKAPHDSKELKDDDLKSVSGGMSSFGGASLSAIDTGSCVSHL
ncbi:MAG: hypothetical protein ABI609_09145 [Acidobacteriota bacterium]